MERIHLEQFPGLGIDFVFLSEKRRKVHQNSDGLTGDIPPSDTAFQTFFGQRVPPFGHQSLAFMEIGSRFISLPEVGTDEKHLVCHEVLHSLGAR